MSKKRRSTFKKTSSAPRSRSTVRGRYILRSDRQPVPETLYQLSTSKKRLSALPEDVRLTLILCGHIANEITTLHRLLLFTMKEHENPVLNGYADFQSWVIIRLLVGKVAEGVEVLQKRIFGQPFGRTAWVDNTVQSFGLQGTQRWFRFLRIFLPVHEDCGFGGSGDVLSWAAFCFFR